MTSKRDPTSKGESLGSRFWIDDRQVDFSKTDSVCIPPEVRQRDAWMAGIEVEGTKLTHAPWRNHPATSYYRDEGCERTGTNPEWSWADPTNWTDYQTVDTKVSYSWKYKHRAFVLQRKGDPYRKSGEADPFLLLDWDDVRDSGTGDVIPEVPKLLNQLISENLTFIEVSASGGGLHTPFEGTLPDEQKQAFLQLRDEPVFNHDDPPVLEIYEGPHVWWVTGDRVKGSPETITQIDDERFANLLTNASEAHPNALTGPSGSRRDSEGTDQSSENEEDTIDSSSTESDTVSLKRTPIASTEPADSDTLIQALDTETANLALSKAGRALAHIDPDVQYPTWFRLALAVNDHFEDTSDAETLFLVWSRGALKADDKTPRKWDADAPEKARRIIRRASPAGETGVTAGTLFRLARKAGFDPASERESTAFLPTAVNEFQTGDDTNDDGLSMSGVRDRVINSIARAYQNGNHVLIDTLPTTGKSHGAISAAAITGKQITILTGRGREEQYEQIVEWCKEYGLSYLILPSFLKDCPTAAGKHGEEWKERVIRWYRCGVTPRQIHKLTDYIFGEQIPCQHDHNHCPYQKKWKFAPDNYDVLIGHYKHAYAPKVTIGRISVFDEFPGGAYETTLDENLQSAVSVWLSEHEEIPFEGWGDLIDNRADNERRAKTLHKLVEETSLEPDGGHVISPDNDSVSQHALAPLAVFFILAPAESRELGEQFENGWERAEFPDDTLGAFNRNEGRLHLLRPPDLTYATGVVALDGTPTPGMWEIALGEQLSHQQVLSDTERRRYITDVLNHQYVRTTEATKSYSPKESEISNRVTLNEDKALLEAISEKHGQQPPLITTNRAEDLYETEGVLDKVSKSKHYGNILGSNEFKTTRLGVVIGSRNFGPQYVQKWCVYAGEPTDPVFPAPDNDFQQTDYGEFGNKIRSHMCNHQTLQTAMRFGRDGNGAIVYIHTNTLPDWVPIAAEGRVLNTWSEGLRGVKEALADRRQATTKEITEHPAVSIESRQVLNHCEKLQEQGVLQRQQDPADGRRTVWMADNIHRTNEHGEVELPPIDLDELSESEVDELARITSYRREFVNSEQGAPQPTTGSDVSTAVDSNQVDLGKYLPSPTD